MGDAIEEFNESFAKEEAHIEALKEEVAQKSKRLAVINSEIFTHRKEAENCRSNINTLMARLQASEVLREKNRRKLDKEMALLEGQQNELNGKKEYLKECFTLEREKEVELIKTITGMTNGQLAERKKVLSGLGVGTLHK